MSQDHHFQQYWKIIFDTYLRHDFKLNLIIYSHKSSKYLANQIKRNREKVTIVTIKDSAGKPTNSPQEINTIFRNLYAKLFI